MRDKAVEALNLFLGESAVPDGMELFTEASAGLRALEQARPAAQRAIADPGDDVPTPKVDNF